MHNSKYQCHMAACYTYRPHMGINIRPLRQTYTETYKEKDVDIHRNMQLSLIHI